MVTGSTVMVAVDRENPPYAYAADGDELRGASVELVRRVFAGQGIEVVFVPVEGLVKQTLQLVAGVVDAAADLTITERRSALFRFSDRYLLEELQVFGLKHGPPWPGWRTFHGMLGVKVDSYAHEYLVRAHPGVPLVPVGTTAQLLDLLKRGEAQAIVLSRATGEYLARRHGADELVAHGQPFGLAPLALAALPENEDLVAAFNRGLAAIGGARSYADLLAAV
jgi:two-component system sensor histidine kinase EvgS